MMNGQRIGLAVAAALILCAGALSGACVEKVGPCEEFSSFAEIYATGCPEVEAWATQCASNLDEMPLEARQDFDWCVECYRIFNDDLDTDCRQAPLGAGCPVLLNDTLDASCNWPVPST
jgi:hypothetical protein